MSDQKDNKSKFPINEKIDIIKWLVNTVIIGLLTFFFTWILQERKQGIEEIQVYNQYVNLITQVDGLPQRRLLAEFFSNVTASGKLKKGWKDYYDVLNTQYVNELSKQDSIIDAVKLTTEKDSLEKSLILAEAQFIKQSLLSVGLNEPIISEKTIPIVYFQITKEDLRRKSDRLVEILKDFKFDAYGTELVKTQLRTSQVRYFRNSDLALAQQINSILKENGLKAELTAVSHLSDRAKPGLIEVWINE